MFTFCIGIYSVHPEVCIYFLMYFKYHKKKNLTKLKF